MTLKLVVAAVFCFVAAVVSISDAQPTFVYHFDAATAAGVKGSIRFKYAGNNSSIAVVSAALDFSRVDQSAVQAFDRACVEPVTEYKWHIHARWSSRDRSASFAQCSLRATGNHYDPLFACSPDSEHVDLPRCKAKSAKYTCNPENYAENARLCEKGDLSGKFGNLVLSDEQTVMGKWTDKYFPLPSENRPNWSIVLHAVCGNHATRIACAKEEMV
ncbi:ATP-dependent DNA helicase Q4 [Phytophthora pseudosyringae]|uniref:ATP-dependent DNA helicase Q4 n=1 Tax=Phytophthora pseudosyringae TaxID=221518 RepID=A0A8T1W650_9STRA|nr:ATP-dependent DNA helicase Q4 [Phytophthora pseudosyringae]